MGGIIFIQGKGVSSLEQLVKEIILKMFSKADKEKIKKIQCATPETIIEQLIDQVNLLSKDVDSGEQGKEFLLIIDNAEEIIEHIEGDFKSLTAKFLNDCATLSIIVTSRRSMGTLKDTFQGKI